MCFSVALPSFKNDNNTLYSCSLLALSYSPIFSSNFFSLSFNNFLNSSIPLSTSVVSTLLFFNLAFSFFNVSNFSSSSSDSFCNLSISSFNLVILSLNTLKLDLDFSNFLIFFAKSISSKFFSSSCLTSDTVFGSIFEINSNITVLWFFNNSNNFSLSPLIDLDILSKSFSLKYNFNSSQFGNFDCNSFIFFSPLSKNSIKSKAFFNDNEYLLQYCCINVICSFLDDKSPLGYSYTSFPCINLSWNNLNTSLGTDCWFVWKKSNIFWLSTPISFSCHVFNVFLIISNTSIVRLLSTLFISSSSNIVNCFKIAFSNNDIGLKRYIKLQ